MNKIVNIKLVDKYDSFEKCNTAFLIFESDEKINFQPWQFMILDNWKIKRPYSIATSPIIMDQEKKIWFYVKKVSENWMSNYLVNDISVWDTIKMQGPFWNMKLKKAWWYILISIWSGLAPILSILQHLYLSNFNWKIVNLFGERFISNLIPQVIEDMNLWATKLNLENYILLSREDENKIKNFNLKYDKIFFAKWHIQDRLEIVNEVFVKDNTLIYICWKPSMVDEVVDILLNLWFDKTSIFFEKY